MIKLKNNPNPKTTKIKKPPVGRKLATEPSVVESRMIELAKDKNLTLNRIGEIVADEIGRGKSFSREYVRQVFKKWSGRLQVKIHKTNKITDESWKIKKDKAKTLMDERARDFNPDLPPDKLAEKWGLQTKFSAKTTLFKYRKIAPALFPYSKRFNYLN